MRCTKKELLCPVQHEDTQAHSDCLIAIAKHARAPYPRLEDDELIPTLVAREFRNGSLHWVAFSALVPSRSDPLRIVTNARVLFVVLTTRTVATTFRGLPGERYEA